MREPAIERKAKDTVRWEYKVVRYELVDVGALLKKKPEERYLDPEVTDWMSHTFRQHGRNQDVARLAWSERRCWTFLGKVLNELGEDGRELVAAPTTSSLTAELTTWFYPDIELVFKRPRLEGVPWQESGAGGERIGR